MGITKQLIGIIEMQDCYTSKLKTFDLYKYSKPICRVIGNIRTQYALMSNSNRYKKCKIDGPYNFYIKSVGMVKDIEPGTIVNNRWTIFVVILDDSVNKNVLKNNVNKKESFETKLKNKYVVRLHTVIDNRVTIIEDILENFSMIILKLTKLDIEELKHNNVEWKDKLISDITNRLTENNTFGLMQPARRFTVYEMQIFQIKDSQMKFIPENLICQCYFAFKCYP